METVLSRRVLSLIFIANLPFWQGCGGELKGEDNDLIAPRNDREFAEEYFVEDLDCQSGEGVASIRSAEITQFQSGGLVKRDVTLSKVSSSDSLSNEIISRTIYDFHRRTECSNTTDTSSCGTPNKSETVSGGRSLRICREHAAFSRRSYEGVGMTAMHAITEAHTFYQDLPSKSPDLGTARLLVLPLIEEHYSLKSGALRHVATDNLAYATMSRGEPLFIVFPKGAAVARRGLWDGYRLWEVPWGLAHEFGHHVFQTHVDVDYTSAGFRLDDFGDSFAELLARPSAGGQTADQKDHARKTTETANLQLVRSVGAREIWGSLNEGFADLFAYYSLGAQPSLMSGVDCLGESRDIDSRTFGDGSAKVLSNTVLRTFQSSTEAGGSRNCSAPNFQDIHSIGAILAHGIDRIFATYLDRAIERGERLLQWAQALRAEARRGSISAMNFAIAVRHALPDSPSAPQCQVVREVFPALQAEILSDTDCN